MAPPGRMQQLGRRERAERPFGRRSQSLPGLQQTFLTHEPRDARPHSQRCARPCERATVRPGLAIQRHISCPHTHKVRTQSLPWRAMPSRGVSRTPRAYAVAASTSTTRSLGRALRTQLRKCECLGAMRVHAPRSNTTTRVRYGGRSSRALLATPRASCRTLRLTSRLVFTAAIEIYSRDIAEIITTRRSARGSRYIAEMPSGGARRADRDI